MSDDSGDPLGGETPEQGELFDAVARLRLDLNDTGNARRLAAVLKGEAIHVAGRGWGVWDGTRYQFESGGARMLSLAGCLQRLHEEEAAALTTQPAPRQMVEARMAETGETHEVAERKIKADRAKKRRDFAKSCGNIARIRNAVELAVSDFLVDIEALDADRAVLQVANGTLDLAEIARRPEHEEDEERIVRWQGALRPHDRSTLPTRVAGCAFDPQATAPEWERFIALAQPSAAERAYLQRCLGMVLGGRAGEVFFIALGQGSNGKSTTVKAVEHVMGDYAQPCRIAMFLEHRYSGGTGPTPEEAVLPGARVYTAQEPKPGDVFDAGKIKGLTGGDRRQANPKNKDVFNYWPVGVPLLQAQRMPIVNDPSEGFWRRCHPIQFKRKLSDLPEEERRDDQVMLAAIKRELPGILNWLLAGYAEFRAVGLQPPPDVMALKQSLRALADPVGQFLAEKTRTGTGLEIRTSELHKAFVKWSEAQGDKPMSAKAFTASMLALDYERFKRDVWFWRGLELADLSLLDGD